MNRRRDNSSEYLERADRLRQFFWLLYFAGVAFGLGVFAYRAAQWLNGG